MKEYEAKYKAPEGSGMLHEVTEGYALGLKSIELERNIQGAWRKYDKEGNETISPDYYLYYEVHSTEATPDPSEINRPKIRLFNLIIIF